MAQGSETIAAANDPASISFPASVKVNCSSVLTLVVTSTTYANCERLAWLYIVRDHITRQQAAQPTPLSVDPSSEFLQAVDGKDSVAVFSIIDDLMDTVRVTAPRAYDSVMRRVLEIS